jgi:hypothetical protein
MITTGTAVGLDRAGGGDGADFVLVTVGPDFQPAQNGW